MSSVLYSGPLCVSGHGRPFSAVVLILGRMGVAKALRSRYLRLNRATRQGAPDLDYLPEPLGRRTMATTFATLETTTMVNIRGWTLWANSHDWGQGPHAPAWYDEETHEMVTYAGEHDGFTWTVVEARHKSPAAMKAWAGY